MTYVLPRPCEPPPYAYFSHQPVSGVNAAAYSAAAGSPGDAAAREATKELLGSKAAQGKVRRVGWCRRVDDAHWGVVVAHGTVSDRSSPIRHPCGPTPFVMRMRMQTLDKYSK